MGGILLYFPSKRDRWFFFIIWGTIAFINLLPLFLGDSTGNQFISSDTIVGSIFIVLISIPLIWIWFNTGYLIEASILKIKFGPFRWTIKITSINKINKVKHPFNAPALSVHRLELQYGNYDIVCVSPKNIGQFIELLLRENPDIQVDEAIIQQND